MLTNPDFYSALLLVIEVFGATLLFSLPLGLLLALGRIHGPAPVSWLISSFITLMRGTPLLLQIIFVYFGIPVLVAMFYPPGADISSSIFVLDQLPAIILAFSLNYAAYFAEIYRGGLLSIPSGQFEAAKTLGFGKWVTYRRIILPQLLKRILPPLANEVITLVKDTSLVYAIGMVDVLKVAQTEVNKTASLLPLVYAAAVYLLIVSGLTYAFGRLEKRLSYYR
ncbi:amino acid ABC transporter permease [Actinomycetaceae bacterium TAE3-ERU4]|nr:amino acid ABC transporter permease [Actinomycetaceae bacterium TAE3-ERU4]